MNEETTVEKDGEDGVCVCVVRRFAVESMTVQTSFSNGPFARAGTVSRASVLEPNVAVTR